MAELGPYWNLNLAPAVFAAAVSVLCLLPLVWAGLRSSPRRKRWSGLLAYFALMLLLNPFAQWILLEPLNMYLLRRMGEQASAVKLKGMRKAEVAALFGPPSFTWSYASPGSETWNYRPVRFYWAGSKFQAHFQDGIVTGWETYDD